MSIKLFKPLTPSLRFLKQINYKNIFLKNKPIKYLCKGFSRCFGRNNTGRITSYHKGGGVKRKIRILISLFLDSGIVKGFEYDPFHSSFLIRILDLTSFQLFYQIAPAELTVGDIIKFHTKAFPKKIGHSSTLRYMPLGLLIHNLNFSNNIHKKISVSAGTFSQIIQKTDTTCTVKISSGQLKTLSLDTLAVLGKVSNSEHRLICIGKAGRNRWLNRRPIVRGVAMNPIDHPHGGGQGKTSAGRPSVSPWGKLTKGGVKTRNKKK